MSENTPESPEDAPELPPPAELGRAGAVIDKAVEYLMSQNIGSLAIASSLLGGALGMLARTMSDDAIVRILDNAIDSVNSGELRGMTEPDA